MTNGLKGINKIVNMGKSVARQTTRAMPVILPALTIAANVADVAATSGGNIAVGLNEIVKRYSFVDVQAGKIDASAGMKGAGALVLSTFAGMLVSALS